MMKENIAEARFLKVETKPSKSWPKILLFLLLGLIFAAGLFLAGYQLGQKQVQPRIVEKPIPTPFITPLPTPTSGRDCLRLETLEMEELARIPKIDCQECGGKWELLSMDLNKTGCNPKTSDAGKTCTDSEQCIGVCLGKETVLTSGTCSEYKFVLGCNLEFSEGEQVMICRD